LISTTVGKAARVALVFSACVLCALHPAHAQGSYAYTDLGPTRNEVPGGTGSGNPGTGTNSFGFAVSASGHVTGNADTYVSEVPYGMSGTQDVQHAFLYTGTGIKQDLMPLPVMPGSKYYSPAQCYGYGLNRLDSVVGYSQAAVSTGQVENHATLWQSGTPVDLGTLYNALYPGNDVTNQQNTNSYALAVSDGGQVVGQAFDYSQDPDYHAFLYNSSSGTMTDIASALYQNQPYNLSSTQGYYESAAFSINSSGQIAGYVYYYSEPGDPNEGTYNHGNPLNNRYPVFYDPSHPGNTQVLLKYSMTNELISVQGGPPVNGFAQINNTGSIIYDTADESNSLDAILWTGGNNYTDLGKLTDTAGNSYSSDASSANGFNDANQVVGTVEYPYDTTTHTFSPTTGTASFNAALWQNGHVYALASLTDLPPGVTLADATGINDAGQIVGTAYVSGGGYHAFLLTPSGIYHVVDLGPVTVNSLNNQGSTVYAINNYGQIVGANGLWTPDAPNDSFSPNGFVGLGLSSYNAINDLGAVAGQSASGLAVVKTPMASNATGYPSGIGFTTGSVPLLGTAPPVPGSTPPSSNGFGGIKAGSAAYGVNDSGQVTGWSTTNTNWPEQLDEELTDFEGTTISQLYCNQVAGFLETPGSASINVNTFAGPTSLLGTGEAVNVFSDDGVPGGGVIANNGVLAPPMVISPGGTGINKSGQIAGWGDEQYLDSLNGTLNQPNPDVNKISAYFYDPGTASITAIPALDNTGTGFDSPSQNPFALAYSLNDAAQVVGQSESNDGYGYVQHGFLWQPDGSLFDLGALSGTQMTGSQTSPASGGQLTSVAYHINSLGQAVGWSDTMYDGQSNNGLTASSVPRAVLWSGDAITDLNSEIIAPGWVLQQANGINDRGQIIGEGTLNGVPHAFLLEPQGLMLAPRNVTRQITVAVTGHTYLRGVHTYALKLSNTGAAVSGPLSLVLDNLPASTQLLNASGNTSATNPAGSPYVTSASGLAVSGSVSILLRLNMPLTSATSFRVLAGLGAP
jgi:probable HAF family extracellular repeat protein